MICAAGLRKVGAVAPAGQGAQWNQLADAIVADAASDCLHPSGRWQRAPGDARVDAALLLPAIRGGLPADDPRTRTTLDAVRSELARDGYVYRFRQDARPLADAEGAFVLCGFLMALATDQQGEQVEAARLFERNRAACGPPGLFTEEYDINQRQLRGNLPQAFVHALLLESAHTLAGPEDEGEGMTPPQIVEITGATAGIARATAKAFGARGAHVALLARGQAGLDGAVKDVEQAGGKPRSTDGPEARRFPTQGGWGGVRA